MFFNVGEEFEYPFSQRAVHAGEGLKRRVYFQVAVIDRLVVYIENHFNNAIAFVHRIKQISVALLRFMQGLLGLLLLGHIARGAEPLDDFPLRIQQWNCMREGPAQAAVHGHDLVFHLEKALGSDRFIDDCQHARLIIGVNVFLQPGIAGFCRIGDEVLTVEKTHFAPVRTHAIDDVRTRRHQRAKALLALSQGFLGLLARGYVEVGGEGFQRLPIRTGQGGPLGFNPSLDLVVAHHAVVKGASGLAAKELLQRSMHHRAVAGNDMLK